MATSPKPRPMAEAPKDGTLVRLFVDYTEEANPEAIAEAEAQGYAWRPHPLEDEEAAWTLGHNNLANDGADRWQFAGWCWSQDHYTQGSGTPIGWLPLHGSAEDDQVQLLRDEVTYWRQDAAARLRTAMILARAAEAEGEENRAAEIRVGILYPTRAALRNALSGDIYYPLCEHCSKPLQTGDAVYAVSDDGDCVTGEVHVDCAAPQGALPPEAYRYAESEDYGPDAIAATLAAATAFLDEEG